MEEVLQTERLKIRRFNIHDALFVLQLTNTEGWLKYIGDRNTGTEELARTYLQNWILKSYQEHGFGGYLVELKDSGEAVGMCGLFKRDALEYPDIGFAFLPDHNGKGYGYEAASAVLEYAINELGMSKIMGITLPSNRASIALLEKIGLKFSGMTKLADDAEELMLFCN